MFVHLYASYYDYFKYGLLSTKIASHVEHQIKSSKMWIHGIRYFQSAHFYAFYNCCYHFLHFTYLIVNVIFQKKYSIHLFIDLFEMYNM